MPGTYPLYAIFATDPTVTLSSGEELPVKGVQGAVVVNAAVPSPTSTQTAPCTGVPCSGSCAVCPPCTPGTICPNNCELRTCEMVSGSCACAPGISTPTPTPPPALPCVGDCNGDRAVTVDEIVRMVNIALNGDTSPSICPGSEQWCSSGPVLGIGITCLIDAVNDALNGCPTATPSPTRTPTSTSTARPTPEFGVCYEQVDCAPLPFATQTDREFCCVLAPHGSFSWCAAADIDPVTGLCTHCVYPCAIPAP
jgi:hypothetical protein